ncbi:PREDICTED: uncharacterized protein LOC104586175 [Nelumbo nucifera]|uniref:Glycosyl transferase family 1 domain-containing protein n=2 Tax=Nelumbo nucifera TaxID=4432 RepID=A0A822YBG0_NELNU|nr:PREDICTED: uncharacterized protein LOC104586175 [Nelumbo nucifera]DAD28639.1 TPA_asm: hypothetical protein HUJ06_030107 [Nelumbo nucifera]
MGRSSSAEILSPAEEIGGLGFRSIRDRLRFKRSSLPEGQRNLAEEGDERDRRSDRQWRSRAHPNRGVRKGFPFKGTYLLYGAVFFAIALFIVGSLVLQSSIASVFRPGGDSGGSFRKALKFGTSLKFVPKKLLDRFEKHGGLNRLRLETRLAVRPPRLAIILGNMEKSPSSLLLFTVMKNLQGLGYVLKIYAVEDGQVRSLWEQIGGQVSILSPDRTGHVDWSLFEGIIVDSVEARKAISSLMLEPFCSIPMIWIIQEDDLAKRLPIYEEMRWDHIITEWRSAFGRADVVVFPDFSLPMLHSVLDTGNFFVVPGSPVDVWAAESYAKSHSKYQLKKDNGFHNDDLVVLIVGSSFFYNKLSWDYAMAMHAIGPLLIKLTRRKEEGGSFKFVFLCGNSTDGYNDALKEVASHLGLPHDSVRHYGIDGDANSILLMADIVLYGSFQDEQGFPPLLIRAMAFGIPVIAPDIPVIKKYVVDGVHVLIFKKNDPDTLLRAFFLLITNRKLSKFALTVASSGRLLAKNMMASECIASYALLLENILHFPSDALLPHPISQLQGHSWEWNSFRNAMERGTEILNFDQNSSSRRKISIVRVLEEEFASHNNVQNIPDNETGILTQDSLTQLDWDVLRKMESSEDFERREIEELEDRMEKDSSSWDEIYRNARKSEKLKFEANERDEGELERTGQPLCIYEIYSGAGAWPFLHHGSLYRGLSLSANARRLNSDDVDAVGRLPVLNDTYYRDLICEIGGMFSIANRVDNIHNIPWIGFQSWRAAGKMVSLSVEAEEILERTIQAETKGNVIYYWARLDLDSGVKEGNDMLSFWSICDILNGGQCRAAFADAFRQMYDLPSHIEALPPMPEDGGHWSALHSWVMPTPSFMEFVMFSRMFLDSLDSLGINMSRTSTCFLGSSELEKKHCYCRMLELLVNVWAYHSAQKMVYIDPHTGLLEEQHPIEERKEFMWTKYFNFTLLKSMDEDLAEAADDNDPPRERWLWPLTGEVYWQGIYEREREERYRQKMEKKLKTKEKLLYRQKYGYSQKTLGL